jgi:hypothetical protein
MGILYRMLVGTQGRSGRVRKTSPPPGFDPRAVQPVTSYPGPRSCSTYFKWRISHYKTLCMQKRQNIHSISTQWTNQDAKTPPKLSFALYIHSLACTTFAPFMSTDRRTYRMNKKIHAKIQQMNPHQNSRKKYYMKVGLLRRGFHLRPPED